jgi:hypothetical protein
VIENMPASFLQYAPLVAVIISLLALLISFANFGWNIYKELALKARLKVRFSIQEIYHESFPKPLTKVFLSAINFGPGPIKIVMVSYKEAGMWNRILRKIKYGSIIWDYTEILSHKLPKKLAVGDSIDLLFKYGSEFKLNPRTTHIGLRDSFDRVHWAPHRDVIKFKEAHKKSFPEKSGLQK